MPKMKIIIDCEFSDLDFPRGKYISQNDKIKAYINHTLRLLEIKHIEFSDIVSEEDNN